MKRKKIIAIVQARLGSSRLPRKVLRPVLGTPLIIILIERLKKVRSLDQIVVAIPEGRQDDELHRALDKAGIKVFRGHGTDVLHRYSQCAQQFDADVVVRITGDCPLIDPVVVDQTIALFFAENADYSSNTLPPTYPDGLDVEVIDAAILHNAARTANALHDREHVTPAIRDNKTFKKSNLLYGEDISRIRVTVDEPEDLETITKIIEHFGLNADISVAEIASLYECKPSIFEGNKGIKRNEGQDMSNGQKIWQRAKKVIPGGNMLLSKRPEMFLPNGWPTYFSTAKGCTIIDVDGRELLDMCIMGIGTNILGYGDEHVDQAVFSSISAGNMSTLNCVEEVLLAEELIRRNPWSDKVRSPALEAKLWLLPFELQEQRQLGIKLPFAVITGGTIGTFRQTFKMEVV